MLLDGWPHLTRREAGGYLVALAVWAAGFVVVVVAAARGPAAPPAAVISLLVVMFAAAGAITAISLRSGPANVPMAVDPSTGRPTSPRWLLLVGLHCTLLLWGVALPGALRALGGGE